MEKLVKRQEIAGEINAGKSASQLANKGISNRFGQEIVTRIKLGKKS